MRRTILRFSMVTLTTITLSLGGGVLGASRAGAIDAVIVDTLGAATPDTTFSGAGGGGQAIISGLSLVGPRFTLTEETVITEIGGFVSNCKQITSGVPECPGTLPFTVQIRPSTGSGVPALSKVLATVVLPHDDDPLVVSYESASTNLVLKPGTYFALFAAQGDDAGFLLSSAQIPFSYQAGSTTLGFLFPDLQGRFARFSADTLGAVRILGHPVVQ
jgi:hypothetical protein